MQEMQDKDVICMLDQTGEGTSFFRRLSLKEVCMYVDYWWVEVE